MVLIASSQPVKATILNEILQFVYQKIRKVEPSNPSCAFAQTASAKQGQRGTLALMYVFPKAVQKLPHLIGILFLDDIPQVFEFAADFFDLFEGKRTEHNLRQQEIIL